MNNSLIESLNQDEEPVEVDITSSLRKRMVEVVRIIECLQSISETTQWVELKSLVFNQVVENLEKRIKSETQKKPISVDEIHELNGQLIWAKRYTDLNKLIDVYKTELTSIRSKLNA